MAIRKDEMGRYILDQSDDDTLLYLDVDTSGKRVYLGIYQGHKHQAVNDRLESLDASNFLLLEEVAELIKTLMDIHTEMETI